jgi:microcystin degradation protein MlrC
MSKPKRRIAIAGISHETNTYCRDQTYRESFHQLRGERILRVLGQETSLGGALAACNDLGFQAVPILAVTAQPSGTINYETYQEFKSEILDGLIENAPLDGIYLDLHGAGVVNGIDDLEADLLIAIRSLVGNDVPITASFDLHGNITQQMADVLDGSFACHQYPHIDMHLRAEEAVRLIARMLDDDIHPVTYVVTVPMLIPLTTTFRGIGEQVLSEMLAAESEQGVIDVSWFHGFPYTDIAHIGSYIVVTTESDRLQAERIACQLALMLWQRREDFRPLSLSAEQAIAVALTYKKNAVVINETSDNCGGGAPGDGTHLLSALLKAGLEKVCFGFMVDPQVAAQAHAAGVGSTINVSLGGRYDELHGLPLELAVYVKALHNGRLTMLAMAKGSPINLGKMARLVVAGVDIIVASNRSQTFDTGPFTALDIDVKDYRIVALKSSNHFRAGFKGVATHIVTADTPGLTTHQIEVFPRRKKAYPLWPLDELAQYPI